MFCPQCGAGLGEGARGCAACGWAASRKTLWIVLGSIFGLIFLVCCGAGTVVFFKAKKAGEIAMTRLAPEIVFIARVQVLNYAKKHGSLPENLAKAQEEPLTGKGGEEITFQNGNEIGANDGWGHLLRYSPAKDGTYEVRSSGPDGTMDNADDVVEKGALTDDLEALKVEAAGRVQKAVQDMQGDILKSFGVDPEKLKKRHGRGGVTIETTPAPSDGTNPTEAPKDPKEWGPKPAEGGGEKPVEPTPPK